VEKMKHSLLGTQTARVINLRAIGQVQYEGQIWGPIIK